MLCRNLQLSFLLFAIISCCSYCSFLNSFVFSLQLFLVYTFVHLEFALNVSMVIFCGRAVALPAIPRHHFARPFPFPFPLPDRFLCRPNTMGVAGGVSDLAAAVGRCVTRCPLWATHTLPICPLLMGRQLRGVASA